MAGTDPEMANLAGELHHLHKCICRSITNTIRLYPTSPWQRRVDVCSGFPCAQLRRQSKLVGSEELG